MKRAKIIFLIAFLIGICSACGNKYYENRSEMIEILQEESRTSAAMSECAYLQLEENALIFGVVGDSEQTYNYYAAQFFEKKAGKYIFQKTVPLDNLGWQLRGCQWNTGYVLFCNNENVAQVKVSVTTNGITDTIADEEVNGIPWSYYLELSNYQKGYNMDISFLDINGKEIE